MGMTRQKTPRLKFLLDKVPPGFLVDTAWLKKRGGIGSKSIYEYVKRGWLEHVVHGVYRRPFPARVHKPADTDWYVPLLSLQWIMDREIHLGGESALDLAGYSHYLMLGGRPRVYLYGNAPSWLKRLPTETKFVIRNPTLFGGDPVGIIGETRLNTQSDMQMVEVWQWQLKTSSPERAIMEALDEVVTNDVGLDNLSKIFEGLTFLRPKLLTQLLKACRSVKVRRLFFVLADHHQHAWRKYVDTSSIDFGCGPRALIKGGKLHPTYRIYVPTDLMPSYRVEDADG